MDWTLLTVATVAGSLTGLLGVVLGVWIGRRMR